MVIHTKEEPKLHLHGSKEAQAKANNNNTFSSGPNMQDNLHEKHNKNPTGKIRYRRSDTAPTDWNKSIKLKKGSIKLAGAATAKTVTDQMDGGEEIQKATAIAYATSRTITGTASKGADLFRQRSLTDRIRKLKKVQVGKKVMKSQSTQDPAETVKSAMNKARKRTAENVTKASTRAKRSTVRVVGGDMARVTLDKRVRIKAGDKLNKLDAALANRNRKLKFFLDKMKAEDKQNDSISKLAKDLISSQAMILVKKAITSLLGSMLGFFLLIAVACIPVVAVVAVIYNSPFAIFFPSLEDGETVMSVTREYEADFNRTINALASAHTGYDNGDVVYVNYEGSAALPSNYYDVMVVYMVKFGVGDTATIMNDTSKARLQGIFDDMCSYTTSVETETHDNEDGSTTTLTTVHVNVSLKSYRDMISIYHFSSDEIEMLEEIMKPENHALLGDSGEALENGGGNPVSELSSSQITEIVGGITNQQAKQAISFALSKVGYPYSQDYRDSGSYYDCSSLVYYSWRAAGKDISFGGATTAAAEGQGLEEAGKTVSYEEMQPGDLIFYSYCKNGRYRNISHVAVYVGNGKVVEAANTRIGVVYREIQSRGSIVMIGRP